MKNRGVITLVFDDGYEKVYQNAVPLLRRYHLPAVFALPLEGSKLAQTEQRQIRPWRKWLHLRDEGHEIAAHSITHRNLTKISPQELEEELAEPVQKLNATTIVYPGGALDEGVVETAKKFYTAGRTVHYGFERLVSHEPLRLKSYNFSRNNFSVPKANLLALTAWITGAWLIETYHMIDHDDREMIHTVKTKDLEKHLLFISRLPIAVKTIQAVIENKSD